MKSSVLVSRYDYRSGVYFLSCFALVFTIVLKLKRYYKTDQITTNLCNSENILYVNNLPQLCSATLWTNCCFSVQLDSCREVCKLMTTNHTYSIYRPSISGYLV